MTFTFLVEALQFFRPLEDLTINEFGIPASFECEVSKDGLTPDWYKGSQQVTEGPKYDIIREGKVHRLVIKDCVAEDDSEYTVKFPDLESTAKLTIKGTFHCLRVLIRFEHTETFRYL